MSPGSFVDEMEEGNRRNIAKQFGMPVGLGLSEPVPTSVPNTINTTGAQSLAQLLAMAKGGQAPTGPVAGPDMPATDATAHVTAGGADNPLGMQPRDYGMRSETSTSGTPSLAAMHHMRPRPLTFQKK